MAARGDVGVFAGGGRAALLQLAHPGVAHAVDHHSRTRADVLGRFQRTFRNVFAMIFGELDEAFAAARRVHQIHTRVTGTLPHAVGAWDAGTPYAANDADALRWVHATLVDSVLVVRARLGKISARDRDAYVIEMNRFARLFGIPWALLPIDAAEHDAYMARMIPTLAVAQCAREMAQFLVGRGAHDQPVLGRVSEAVTAQLLPPALVAQFGLRTSRVPVLAALAPIYRALPAPLVALPAHAEARRPGSRGGHRAGSVRGPSGSCSLSPNARRRRPEIRGSAQPAQRLGFALGGLRYLPPRGAAAETSTNRARVASR